jgi:hypothetical protein
MVCPDQYLRYLARLAGVGAGTEEEPDRVIDEL